MSCHSRRPGDGAIQGRCGHRSHGGHSPQDRPEALEVGLGHSPAPGRGLGRFGTRVDWGTAEGGSPASKRLNLVRRARAGRQQRTRGCRTPAQAAAAEQRATLSAVERQARAFWAERKETGLSRRFFQSRKEPCAVGAERQNRAASSQGTLRWSAFLQPQAPMSGVP